MEQSKTDTGIALRQMLCDVGSSGAAGVARVFTASTLMLVARAEGLQPAGYAIAADKGEAPSGLEKPAVWLTYRVRESNHYFSMPKKKDS